MLVLTRKVQQQLHIGNNITITVVRVKGNSVRIGIEAPKDVRIVREEIAELAPVSNQSHQQELSGEEMNSSEINMELEQDEEQEGSAGLHKYVGRAAGAKKNHRRNNRLHDVRVDPRRRSQQVREAALV